MLSAPCSLNIQQHCHFVTCSQYLSTIIQQPETSNQQPVRAITYEAMSYELFMSVDKKDDLYNITPMLFFHNLRGENHERHESKEDKI